MAGNEQSQSNARLAAGARIQFSDLVPDGRQMVEVEVEGETVFCVRTGAMEPALADELNHHWAHATRSGKWLRAETDERPEGHPPV
ncbi:hypothetical protein [Streptomyces sp. NPDC091649]|uniref:hypothetical protein n=1 Tax=Streptomyces sp. NPDC091649 TaxID=3366004 RepID=UPI00382430C9